MKSEISLSFRLLIIGLLPLSIGACTRSSAQAEPGAVKRQALSEVAFVEKVHLDSIVVTGPLGIVGPPVEGLRIEKEGETIILITKSEAVHVPLSNVAWYKVALAK